MISISDIKMPLDYTEDALKKAAAHLLRVRFENVPTPIMLKRAIDARKKDDVHFRITIGLSLNGEETIVKKLNNPKITIHNVESYMPLQRCGVTSKKRPIVIGAGPAGLFAALILANAGLHPLILERGRDVDSRRRDVDIFRGTGVLDTQSNVQFGEGGAGAFSDGKLNTGIKDKRCRFVLETFAALGAPQDILWQSKPHIGTDILCTVIKNLRRRIEELGGEFRFNCQVTDISVKDNAITGVTIEEDGKTWEMPADKVIFAIGHSARDTFQMLFDHKMLMEAKPFAVGVRIEHSRGLIDTAQYGKFAGHKALGAADYKLAVHLPNGRGVYTFCMCPGGVVIAAASENGGVVVNGMSYHARNAENSNSALLVGVQPSDFVDDHPLSGIKLQREMEQAAYRLGGCNYHAPAQLVGDFMKHKPSVAAGGVAPSYKPGITWCDLHECLPHFVSDSLEQSLPLFGKRIRGFDSTDAVLTGVESRSSSPVRLLRNESGQSSIKGLFPCGEGAGYAGGITSAAVDGIRCAEWLLTSL
ncbi:MAG: FAD-dependent monooxygenase [Clostridia bacterium]|nr:FAD-dependent monooxygenase [Clostridia bacterium]